MEERRNEDAQLITQVTGKLVDGLRAEFVTQNKEILKHFVDLQQNTHITTLDICRNYRQQINELKLELEHAQKTAENLRHVVRETKKEDHLEDLRELIDEQDDWCRKVDILYSAGTPVHHRFRNKIK